MSAHEVVDEQLEGVNGVVLVSHAADLTVGFVPGAGMVGYSLRHRGEELLGQRGGLSAYTERGSTFGIPLLHPWANRLSARSYSVSGQQAALDPEHSPVRLDPNGLPIHGVLAASPLWELESRHASQEQAAISARLDFGSHDDLLAAFPLPARAEPMTAPTDALVTGEGLRTAARRGVSGRVSRARDRLAAAHRHQAASSVAARLSLARSLRPGLACLGR